MIFHSTSRKPVLIVGNGARESGIADDIYEFIEKTHIPVLTSMNTVDMVQDKYRIGFIGTYGNRASNMILNECDLVISVGARLGLRQIGHKKELFAPKAKLIRCDIDQYELGRKIKEDEEQYNFDAKFFMEMLLKEDIPDYTDWWNKCKEVKDLLDTYDDTEGNRLIKAIGNVLPENPVVTVDIGQVVCWTAQSLQLKGTKGRIIIGGSYGAMGVGLPYAIGASICRGNALTFCIVGDGGLQMNIQELETVKRENLPIKILVVNNHELGKISEIQHGSYQDRYCITTPESGYTVPDFTKIAIAYGIKAKGIDSYKELESCKDWLEDSDPCLINITLSSLTPLIPKIKWETCTIKPDLDDANLQKVNELLGA